MSASDPSLTGRCLDCDYLLRDLPLPRCPECGRPFDPHDPSTMRMAGAGEMVRRWFAQPLDFVAVAVAVVPMLALVWLFSSPGPYYLGIILVLFAPALMIPLIGLWPAPKSGGRVRRGTLLLIIILTCASIWFLELPLRIRFALSAPSMNRLLREVRAGPGAPRPEREWVGLFEVGKIVPPQYGGTVTRFYEPGSLEVGFGYSDKPVGYAGVNSGAGGHLFGRWYWFSDD